MLFFAEITITDFIINIHTTALHSNSQNPSKSLQKQADSANWQVKFGFSSVGRIDSYKAYSKGDLCQINYAIRIVSIFHFL